MGNPRVRAGRIISVGGGKGGVGKSVVAANLGVATAQAGARTIIVDADLGAANQHTLFGIDRPGPTLQALIERRLDALEQALVPTGVPNLQLIPGSGAVVGAANIEHAQKLKLIRHIRALDADVVIIDVGAGVSFNVLDLFDVADLRLVTLSPQLTSVQNAYAFLKGAVFRELKRLANGPPRNAWVEESPEAQGAVDRVPALLERIRAMDPAFAQVLTTGLQGFAARMVGNLVYSPRERGVFHAMSRMMTDFLGLDVPMLGALRASRRVHDAVSQRRPFLLSPDQDDAAHTLRHVAACLLAEDVEALRRLRESAVPVVEPPPEVELTPPEPDPQGDKDLPASLQGYQRAYERVAVECPATLLVAGGVRAVRVMDVSEGGALVMTDAAPPEVGTRGLLVCTPLDSRPTLPCVVRHTSADRRRAGVEFTGDRNLAKRAAEELVRRYPRSPLPAPVVVKDSAAG